MTMIDLLTAIQPSIGEALTMFVTALVTWFFSRRKQNAETTGIEIDNGSREIDNGSKVVSLYKEALDDLESRYETKYKHVQEMCDNIAKLFEKKEQILLQEIEYHKKQTALYKKMYDDKVREFNKYKKEHP